MATMTSGFGTTLLPRPAGVEPKVWTVWAGSFTTESSGGHNGERVWTPSSSYRAFDAASTYAMAGMEARNLIGFGGNDTIIFALETIATVHVASLRVNTGGVLKVFNGTTLLATAPTADLPTAANFYTVEFAWANTAGAISCETRVGGIRIPSLTTTDFPLSGPHLAGTMSRPAPAGAGGAGAVCTWVNVNDVATAQSPVIYWYWQKNGSSLWTSVATGSTFATISDFTGTKKRAWLSPNAVGNYTMPGAGSGTQNSNWTNGAGTYPSNIADTGGMDSDTSYIRNQVTGTATAPDKISHNYTDLPGAATTVGFVQRTVLGRLEGAASGQIRTGRRVSAADTADATASLDGTYGAGTPNINLSTFYARQPDGTTIYTPTLVNAFEGIIEMVTVSA